MSEGGRDAASGRYVVTLVIDLPITKPDALEVISFVADGEVEHRGTAHPRVSIAPGVWAEVQIPRFADPPPLAIDVCSDASIEEAAHAADRLAEALVRVGWTVRRPRAGEG
ncbi:hypothetical protein ACSBPH_07310 [Microbacterium sp. F51-2R]|uniref:hypothetical protein n=1 Tax=Microbacterium sp. F51-2R TaxID=3445777 RepID=UPI003F9F75F6